MAYQKGKLNQEFLSVASLGNNQPTGIIQKATDGYAKNAYGKPIDNGGFLTELNLLGKSEQNKEEVNEYSISGYSEVVKSENLLNPDLFKTNLDTYSVNVANITENIFLILWVSPYAKIIADRKILLTNIQNNGTIEVTFTITQTENVRIQIGYDSDGVVINDIELQSGTYSIITSYKKTENIIKFSNLCLRVGNETTYIPYFDPYIKNAGIKNIMKSVLYGSTTINQYSPVVAFGANVQKGHTYYLQYEIFKEGLSNLYSNHNTNSNRDAVLDRRHEYSNEVGIHSYKIITVIDSYKEDSYELKHGHNFGILSNATGGLQLEGNGVSDYIGNFILVDCTGIETPKETLPSNLEYNQYYIKTSDNTLINLGTEPLRQNDIANTNGERINRRYKINLYDFVDKLWRRNVTWSEKGDFELWYCIIDKATTFKYAEGDENSLCAELPHVNIINTATTNSYRIGTIDTEKNVLYLCINRNELNDNTEASIKEWISNHRYNIEYDIETELKERNPQNAIRALPTGLSFTDYHKDNITNTMTTITTPTANFPEDINSLVNPIMDYTGRNLISLEDITTSNYSIKNGVIKFTGTSSYTIKFNKEIKLISGKKYILSRLNLPKLEDNTYGANFHIGYVDSSTNKYQMLFGIGYTKAYDIITPTEDTIVNALNTNGIRLPSVDCCPMLIETTEPPIKFEPYFNINITIPYTLRSIKENNVSDYIKIEKGKVVLVQCVGEYVATGNERYWNGVEVTEHGYTSFNIYSGLSKQKGGNSAYSNWYKNKKTHGSFYLSNGIFMVTQQGYLILRDDFFKSDLPRWVQYLKDMYAKGTPLKIQYILETPIETDITNTEFGNNILQFIRNDFKGGDSYFTLNDSNNNLVHLKYYSTDYQENGEPTTAEKDPITNRYTILIQPIIDNKGIEANVDWVKKEVIY